jgi:hypothetical protein
MAVADLPRVEVTADGAARLRRGQRVPAGRVSADEGEVAVFAPGQEFVGVGRLDRRRGLVAPVKIRSDG